MATKNCPNCNKQVPVACKKCGCGHTFFATRRSANSVSRENPEADVSDQSENPAGDLQPTRRSGRVTRERPNFYDALEYENQTRREQGESRAGKWTRTRKYDSESSIKPGLSLNQRFKNVFVTVGTTKFDDLVKLITEDRALQQFIKWETSTVRIQRGNSDAGSRGGHFCIGAISFEMYTFKSFIVEDMKWADLVICHAGAGTTLEALELGKPLVVVPNRTLMDDHQLELASKLAKEKHAVLTSLETFHEDMKTVRRSWFRQFPDRRMSLLNFANFINLKVLGKMPEDDMMSQER